MLVFAALAPHTPLLLPAIGKENLEKLTDTKAAIDHLAEEIYASHPDTIIVISGHGTRYPDAFAVNLHDPYTADLSGFGDLTEYPKYRPNLMLVDYMQRQMREAGLPFSLYPDEKLDYGTSVPLLALGDRIKDVRVVPISYSDLDSKDHFKFGQALKDIILNSTDRIAVIASGDMSHALSSDSPAGFHADGEIFDAKIQELVSANNAAGLIKLDPEMVKNASECGYRPLLILYGILDKINFRPTIHAYEAPFGVGYLTASFELG